MSGRALCCLWRRWCSGRRVVWLVGPGCLTRPWAAARPRAVRAASFARRVDSLSGQAPPPPTGTAARPGPAAAHGHRSPALRPSGASTPAVRLVLLCVAPSCLLLSNFARNSPVTISVFELASLELERFWAVFKSDRGKLRADLVLPRPCCRPRAPRPGPAAAHGRHSQALLPPTGATARPCCRPRAPQPGPAAAHGHRSLVDAAIVRLALSHAIPL